MWPNENLAVTSILCSSVSHAVTNSWCDLSFIMCSVEHLALTFLSSVPYRWYSCYSWKALKGK